MALTFQARTGGTDGKQDFSEFEDGVYEVELKTIESVPNRFYVEGEEGGGTPEQWMFRFLVPAVTGLEVRTWTNQVMSERSSAQHIIGCLVGRPLTDADAFGLDDLCGKRCKCMLTLDPKSGYPRVKGKDAFIMPRQKAQAELPAAPAPARPAPPPRPALATERALKNLAAAAQRQGIDDAGLNTWAESSFGHGLERLTHDEAQTLLATLTTAPDGVDLEQEPF